MVIALIALFAGVALIAGTPSGKTPEGGFPETASMAHVQPSPAPLRQPAEIDR